MDTKTYNKSSPPASFQPWWFDLMGVALLAFDIFTTYTPLHQRPQIDEQSEAWIVQ